MDESMFEELGAEELAAANGGWRVTFSSDDSRCERSSSRQRGTRIFSTSREAEVTVKVFVERGVELT